MDKKISNTDRNTAMPKNVRYKKISHVAVGAIKKKKRITQLRRNDMVIRVPFHVHAKWARARVFWHKTHA